MKVTEEEMKFMEATIDSGAVATLSDISFVVLISRLVKLPPLEVMKQFADIRNGVQIAFRRDK